MIIDTNQICTAKLLALKAAGVTTIGRYLNRLDPKGVKVIQPDEARAFAAAGMQLFLIFEIGGKPSGAAQGELDRKWCEDYLAKIGMDQSGVSIANTVDYDAQANDMPGIEDYFGAFQSKAYRVMGYGSGFVCGQLFAKKLIALRWIAESRGFTGTKEALAAGDYDLVQSISPALDGIDVDVNAPRFPSTDFGARVPFAASPSIVPPVATLPSAQHETFVQRLREIFS